MEGAIPGHHNICCCFADRIGRGSKNKATSDGFALGQVEVKEGVGYFTAKLSLRLC
jgi:hypothetical protein